MAAVLALYILGGVLATEWLWGQLFGRTERAAFQTTPVYEAFAAELPREAVSIPSGDNALAGPLGKGAGAACF
ncbi:MAG: hypothetical protein LBT60_02025 [Oscillospiraceae bacterium]|nr:hypothetical protein [Oscillospiraceae bacterium]